MGAARVGNDVVDLGDATIAQHHRRLRFVERVLGEHERAALAASTEPHALLWSFFAAKEAAFKVVSKLFGPVVFAHRRFVVATDLGSVRYGSVELAAAVGVEGHAVHAVVWHGDAAPPIRALAALDGSRDASQAARRLLCERASRRLGVPAADLAVARSELPGSWDGFGPPELLLRGVPVDGDVSLSHDGRWVACAAYL